MRQIPFSLFRPNILLKIFLPNTNSLLITVSFNIHVSHEYVTIGLITELYSFNFALFDMSLGKSKLWHRYTEGVWSGEKISVTKRLAR